MKKYLLIFRTIMEAESDQSVRHVEIEGYRMLDALNDWHEGRYDAVWRECLGVEIISCTLLK